MAKGEKCCCCVPLNFGVVIVGLLSLVLDVGRIAAVLLYFPSITRQNVQLDPDDFLQIGLLSILAIFCFVDVLLIYGAIKKLSKAQKFKGSYFKDIQKVPKESSYMVPWMISVWFSWIILIAGFIFHLAKPLGSTYHTFVTLGIFIVYAGLTIGAYVVVYELYMKLMHGSQLTRLLEKEGKINTP